MQTRVYCKTSNSLLQVFQENSVRISHFHNVCYKCFLGDKCVKGTIWLQFILKQQIKSGKVSSGSQQEQVTGSRVLKHGRLSSAMSDHVILYTCARLYDTKFHNAATLTFAARRTSNYTWVTRLGSHAE